MSFFGGHWYPCFGFLVTSPLGFKARVGSALFAIFAEAKVMYIPQDSPLVLHFLTSWQPACSRSLPHMHVQRWDLAQIRTCNRTKRRRTRYHCASDPAVKMFLSDLLLKLFGSNPVGCNPVSSCHPLSASTSHRESPLSHLNIILSRANPQTCNLPFSWSFQSIISL